MEASTPARHEYGLGELPDAEVPSEPLPTFRRWLDEAVAAELPEPAAVVLATVDEHGLPDARVMLLRGLDARGLHFYTNRQSAKGRQLAANPSATVVAHWQPLERQVRLRGSVEPLPDVESDAYFAGRPRGSQLGAWASEQSAPIADRAQLEARVTAAAERFEGQRVPRPDHWGGYLLRPEIVEFWQGRPSRLHDRLRYQRDADGQWTFERLQP